MINGIRLLSWKTVLVGAAGFVLSLAGIWLGWNAQNSWTMPSFTFRIVAVLESLGIGVMVTAGLVYYRQQRHLSENLTSTQQKLATLQHELNGILQINHLLMSAPDEKQLVEAALSLIQELSGAEAISFVAMDEWGIPLPAYSQGRLPRSVMSAWAEHLTSSRVRQTCHQCQKLHAAAGEKCPVLEGPFTGMDVFCLPVRRGERLLGMLNVYLTPGHKLDPELVNFIESILKEVGQAIESFRLQAREVDALRFYQQEEPAVPELDLQLSSLIDDLMPIMDAEAIVLQVESTDPRAPAMRIACGSEAGIRTLDGWTLDTQKPNNVTLKWQGRIQADALTLSDGLPTGDLLVLLRDGVEFGERQRSAIDHISHQVSFFLEMERLHKTLKFEAVIQERTRLAREIHDSLAQTLAFLKLTAAQMQNYLGQGDLPRLNQAIKQSYQALAEAYTDTRKTIDDLRLDPQKNLADSLAQIALNFERENAVPFEFSAASIIPDLPAEIQAQLLRIIQEALNNVRKHARAGHVKLDIHLWEQDLVFQVQDDGRGFLPEEVPEISRYGLRGMRERAEAIGADFQVTSQPGQGTSVMIRLPLPHQEVNH